MRRFRGFRKLYHRRRTRRAFRSGVYFGRR